MKKSRLPKVVQEVFEDARESKSPSINSDAVAEDDSTGYYTANTDSDYFYFTSRSRSHTPSPFSPVPHLGRGLEQKYDSRKTGDKDNDGTYFGEASDAKREHRVESPSPSTLLGEDQMKPKPSPMLPHFTREPPKPVDDIEAPRECPYLNSNSAKLHSGKRRRLLWNGQEHQHEFVKRRAHHCALGVL